MKIAVTGASGNFGSFFVDYVLERGHQVIELGRKQKNPLTKWQYFSLGQAFDFQSLESVDLLVHAAYDFSAHGKDEVWQKNVLPSIDILKEFRSKTNTKVIFLSSVSAFAGCKSIYGKGKLAVESCVTELSGTSIRSALMFADSPQGIVGKLALLAERLPVLPLPGATKNLYVTHMQSLAEAILELANKESPSQLTLAYPIPYSFRRIIEILGSRSKKRPKIIPIPWRAAWLALSILEKLRMPIGFRSDSLVGLMESEANLRVATTPEISVKFRPFEDA